VTSRSISYAHVNKVDIIITGGDSEVRAAKQATRTIPIVMAPSGDPVAAGYVASFAKPGGNITGLSWMSPELSAKLLELLRDTVPRLARVAVLWNATNPVKVLDFDKTRQAAQALGLTVSSIEVRSSADLEMAFAKIVRDRPDGLLPLVDEVLAPNVFRRIAQFAMRERLPSILGEPEYATAGGLVAYGLAGDVLRHRYGSLDRRWDGVGTDTLASGPAGGVASSDAEH
jgi:putative tryptophan/tyrosine transport system substrate-binding protein